MGVGAGVVGGGWWGWWVVGGRGGWVSGRGGGLGAGGGSAEGPLALTLPLHGAVVTVPRVAPSSAHPLGGGWDERGREGEDG